MDDVALLRQYVEEGSQEAFAELVRRHVGLVYSSALRQTRDPHLAEDLTQAVFIALARGAHKLGRDQLLCGWLMTTTRYLVLNALKSASRRKRHERRAAEMAAMTSDTQTGDAWEQIAPVLDEALAELSPKHRDAVLLRYFRGRSVREVAAALGISEDAAKQRLSRAVEQLRGFLAGRGITTPAAVLTGLLSVNAVHAAPAGLAEATAAVSVKCATALAMEKGVVAVMAAIKAKTAVASLVVLSVVGGATGVVAHRALSRPPQATSAAQAAQAGSRQPWRRRFDDVYRLPDGEVLKRVAPPFIPERQALFHEIDPKATFDVDRATGVTTFTWRGDEKQGSAHWQFWSGSRATLVRVLRAVAGIPSYKVEMPPKDKSRVVPGDWVLRPDTSEEAKMQALGEVGRKELGWQVHFEQRQAEHEVIVARGRFTKPADSRDGMVHVFVEPQDASRGAGAGDLREFLVGLGELLDTEVIDEAEPTKEGVFWRNRVGAGVSRERADKLLANVAKQTGLRFARERRLTTRWVAVPVRP